MTNYSRSVLKSNGLRRSKNLPVKFGFTLKTVSANIAKKLPSQRWPHRMGALLLPSDCFTRFRNPAWPGGRTANFAAFGSWSGVLPKHAERAFGTAMRSCASLFRGVAAPLGCVIFFQFCRNCDLYAMRACARHGRYHYPQRALRAAETPDGRLSKRLICRFLRSGGHP